MSSFRSQELVGSCHQVGVIIFGETISKGTGEAGFVKDGHFLESLVFVHFLDEKLEFVSPEDIISCDRGFSIFALSRHHEDSRNSMVDHKEENVVVGS